MWPKGPLEALGAGVDTGTGWSSPSKEERWSQAGPPALRSRSNLTSCILTLGHHNTFQMDVQKPTLSMTQPSQGPGKLTRRGQAKPKGNTGHQSKPAPSLAAGTEPPVCWLVRPQHTCRGLSCPLLLPPQHLPPWHPLQDQDWSAQRRPQPGTGCGQRDRSARPRHPHRAGRRDTAFPL